ncbi:MAG TPA: cation transporter [Rhodothermales bacterium]|nr:cation transporter [Rhodothermales bacterium]
MTLQSESFNIEGMSCGHCVKAVRQALESIDGVDVENVEIGRAQVSYDPSAVDRAHLVEAIEEEGYTVSA